MDTEESLQQEVSNARVVLPETDPVGEYQRVAIKITCGNLKRIGKEKKVTLTMLAEAVGTNERSFGRRFGYIDKEGVLHAPKMLPTDEDMNAVCETLGCSREDVSGYFDPGFRDKAWGRDVRPLSWDEQVLLENYRWLDTEDRITVIRVVRSIRSGQSAKLDREMLMETIFSLANEQQRENK